MATEVNESLTYHHRCGHDYFGDLALVALGTADDDVKYRLHRHALEVAMNEDIRKLGQVTKDTPVEELHRVPPLFLLQWIKESGLTRPYIDSIVRQEMPVGTEEVNIVKALGASPRDDDVVNAPVREIVGSQGIAIDLLTTAPISFDLIVFRDLLAEYYINSSDKVISGTGVHETLGVRNTPGIHQVQAHSGIESFFSAVANGIQLIHVARFLPPEAIIVHPNRWETLAEKLTDKRLVKDNILQGVPVVEEPRFPVDVVHVQRTSDVVLWESGLRARVSVRDENDQPLEHPRLQLYANSAFTAGRFPMGIAEIALPQD